MRWASSAFVLVLGLMASILEIASVVPQWVLWVAVGTLALHGVLLATTAKRQAERGAAGASEAGMSAGAARLTQPDHYVSLRKGFAGILPQAAFLGEWVANTHGPLFGDIGSDRHHRLERYERHVVVRGRDVVVTERYVGMNAAQTRSERLMMLSFGGSIVSTGMLRARVRQHVEGRDIDVELVDRVDSERFKSWEAKFFTPLLPGEGFDLSYSYVWPGAMVYPCDAVFLSPSVFYALPIARIECTLRFEDALAHVGGYSYDICSGVVVAESTQPRRRTALAHDAPSTYIWEIPNPKPATLYFVLFVRYYAQPPSHEARTTLGPAGCIP